MSDNELTLEEKQWTEELTKAALDAGMKPESKYLMACFAIVTKGRVKAGLKRMKNWSKVRDKYKLDEISSNEASEWLHRKLGHMMINVGNDKDGFVGYGVHYGQFFPSVIETDEDERLLIKAVADNMRCISPNIATVRRGTFLMGDAKDMSFQNFSVSLEQKLSSVYQDSFPVKVKKMYMVDPPLIGDARYTPLSRIPLSRAMLQMAKLFLKQKLIERVHFVKPQDVCNYFEKSDLAESMGGTRTRTFWEWRDAALEQYDSTAAFFENGCKARVVVSM